MQHPSWPVTASTGVNRLKGGKRNPWNQLKTSKVKKIFQLSAHT